MIAPYEDEFFTYTPICEDGGWWVFKCPKTISQREKEYEQGKWRDGSSFKPIKSACDRVLVDRPF